MAHPNLELIQALRTTAERLRHQDQKYAWGNHGSCNCGNLLQVVTKLSEKEIIQYARTGTGEWTELAEDYCGVTDAPVGLLISKLQQIGLTPSDIHHIEYLTDKTVLQALPGGFRWLQRNQREDVIVYLETFAQLLEDKMLAQVNISVPELFAPMPAELEQTI
jgi:hypothetical protein